MMYRIPNGSPLELDTLILDLNGTISVRGKIVKGVKERLGRLAKMGYRIILFTGDTRGDAAALAESLGIEWRKADDGVAKLSAKHALGSECKCVVIGNGLIDLPLMKSSKLGIVTLQAEGVHMKTLAAADIMVPSIVDALEMLLEPSILAATLRR
jgi:soluble P-type ATPase